MATGLGVAVLMGAGAFAYAKSRTTETTPHYWAKAKTTPATGACLKANDKLDVPANVRSDIELTAMTYLIDVPAGTNVDIKLATYSTTTATGSDYYPDKYGTYNFAMSKDSSGWRITEFKRCS